MSEQKFPVSLAKVALRAVPARLMQRMVALVAQRLEAKHRRLFKNLAKLQPARVHLIPTDIPHAFGLCLGQEPVSIYLLSDSEQSTDATVSGSLESMIAMLEGHADGDQLFFSREITVTGNSEIIVGLRNTLDREEIDLYAEILSLCGPFAQPASIALSIADRLLRRVKTHLHTLHDDLHKSSMKVR